MHRAIALSISMLLLVLALSVGTACAQPVFGEESSGLSLALEEIDGDSLRIVLRNKGPETADLGRSFAWVLLAASRDSAFYSSRLNFPAPFELGADDSREMVITLSTQGLFRYQPGTRVVEGYPKADDVTPVSIAILPETVRAQAIAYVHLSGEKITVKSRAATISPQPKDVALLPVKHDELLERFRRDPFAAKAAHDEVVKIGPRALPTLEAGLNDTTMPGHGVMWLASAVVNIGGSEAEALAAKLVRDRRSAVRHVIAYHGPGRNSKTLDEAILEFAAGGSDPLFTAWAARGYSQNNREFPSRLIDVALEANEPRARAEIAHVLGKRRDRRLGRLFSDEHELVRVAAANAVIANKITDRQILLNLADSLKLPGDAARQRMVEAAARAMGRNWSYDSQLPEDQKLAQLERIRQAIVDR